jgi:hypothetical protein
LTGGAAAAKLEASMQRIPNAGKSIFAFVARVSLR